MAIDIGSLAAVGSALRSAGEIMKTMVGLRDGVLLQAKAIELNAEIITAQGAALTANANQFTLLDRVRDLEKEVADLKAWRAEKKKYALQQIAPGAFAYVIKPEVRGAEPMHLLCATCYNQGLKSILQYLGSLKSSDARADASLGCSLCKAEIFVKSFQDNLSRLEDTMSAYQPKAKRK